MRLIFSMTCLCIKCDREKVLEVKKFNQFFLKIAFNILNVKIAIFFKLHKVNFSIFMKNNCEIQRYNAHLLNF
jgi:hypothetical protein